MYTEITKGMDDTDIKSGVIGEIGTSAEISENEWKAVRAAAVVHRQTGAGIHVHTSLWDSHGLAVRNTLCDLGVPAEKICINHIDVVLRYDYLVDLCRAGVLVEFDNFGKEYYISGRDRYYMKNRFAYDLERVEVISRLIADGFIDHILITNDICLKSLLHNYGGRGYDHILTNVVPMMEDLNITPEQIRAICIKNPARFLDM
jgi:phosphotriesterase-related protein